MSHVLHEGPLKQRVVPKWSGGPPKTFSRYAIVSPETVSCYGSKIDFHRGAKPISVVKLYEATTVVPTDVADFAFEILYDGGSGSQCSSSSSSPRSPTSRSLSVSPTSRSLSVLPTSTPTQPFRPPVSMLPPAPCAPAGGVGAASSPRNGHHRNGVVSPSPTSPRPSSLATPPTSAGATRSRRRSSSSLPTVFLCESTVERTKWINVINDARPSSVASTAASPSRPVAHSTASANGVSSSSRASMQVTLMPPPRPVSPNPKRTNGPTRTLPPPRPSLPNVLRPTLPPAISASPNGSTSQPGAVPGPSSGPATFPRQAPTRVLPRTAPTTRVYSPSVAAPTSSNSPPPLEKMRSSSSAVAHKLLSRPPKPPLPDGGISAPFNTSTTADPIKTFKIQSPATANAHHRTMNGTTSTSHTRTMGELLSNAHTMRGLHMHKQQPQAAQNGPSSRKSVAITRQAASRGRGGKGSMPGGRGRGGYGRGMRRKNVLPRPSLTSPPEFFCQPRTRVHITTKSPPTSPRSVTPSPSSRAAPSPRVGGAGGMHQPRPSPRNMLPSTQPPLTHSASSPNSSGAAHRNSSLPAAPGRSVAPSGRGGRFSFARAQSTRALLSPTSHVTSNQTFSPGGGGAAPRWNGRQSPSPTQPAAPTRKPLQKQHASETQSSQSSDVQNTIRHLKKAPAPSMSSTTIPAASASSHSTYSSSSSPTASPRGATALSQRRSPRSTLRPGAGRSHGHGPPVTRKPIATSTTGGASQRGGRVGGHLRHQSAQMSPAAPVDPADFSSPTTRSARRSIVHMEGKQIFRSRYDFFEGLSMNEASPWGSDGGGGGGDQSSSGSSSGPTTLNRKGPGKLSASSTSPWSNNIDDARTNGDPSSVSSSSSLSSSSSISSSSASSSSSSSSVLSSSPPRSGSPAPSTSSSSSSSSSHVPHPQGLPNSLGSGTAITSHTRSRMSMAAAALLPSDLDKKKTSGVGYGSALYGGSAMYAQGAPMESTEFSTPTSGLSSAMLAKPYKNADEVVSMLTKDRFPECRQIIFLFHKRFMSSEDLLDRIIGRYSRAVTDSQRVEILHALVHWSKEYTADFSQQSLKSKLLKFLKSHAKGADEDSLLKTEFIMTLQKFEGFQRVYQAKKQRRSSPNSNDGKLAVQGDVDILKFSAGVLAQAIFAENWPLFKALGAREFVGCAWTKEDRRQKESPNIMKLVEDFNVMSFGVATEILRRTDQRQRTEVIRLLISVANESLSLGNYHAVFCIMSGLSLGPVFRLQDNWNEMNWITRRAFNNLKSICSYEGNYTNYRRHISSSKAKTCLPHVAVINKDVFANEQLPTKNESGDVHFKKYHQQFTSLQPLFSCQNGLHTFQVDEKAQLAVTQFRNTAWSEDQLYAASYEFVPRVSLDRVHTN